MFPAQLMHPWMSISSHHQSVGETPLKMGNLLIPQIEPEVLLVHRQAGADTVLSGKITHFRDLYRGPTIGVMLHMSHTTP